MKLTTAEKLTIGCDPEVFLVDKDGSFVNAFHGLEKGIVNGTKARPEPTAFGAIQVDGMAMEFNTVPTDNGKELSSMITDAMNCIEDRFGCNISQESVKEFEPEYLQQQHPMAVNLGCEGDFNAWENGENNYPPDTISVVRTAGGHVHLGFRDIMEENMFLPVHIRHCCDLVKQLDYTLGLWSLEVDKNGTRRRSMYGSAGSFRPKTYGVEYRVLSNFWIFSDELIQEVVKRCKISVAMLEDGFKYEDKYGDAARQIIASGAETHPIIREIEKDMCV